MLRNHHLQYQLRTQAYEWVYCVSIAAAALPKVETKRGIQIIRDSENR
jgi:hypothetical protein